MFKKKRIFLIIFSAFILFGFCLARQSRAFFFENNLLTGNELRFKDSFAVGDPGGENNDDPDDEPDICNLSSIYARAGEPIFFPDVQCEDSAPLAEISWDLNDEDGVELGAAADLIGNQVVLGSGISLPGSYLGTVRVVDQEGEITEQSFALEIANPVLIAGDLVINELMVDPAGEDKALLPEGEWLEIYNNLDVGVDLLGFVLYDTLDFHALVLSANNCRRRELVEQNPAQEQLQTTTLILPKNHLIVYRNGNANFSLNNQGPETVRFLDDFIENQGLILDKVEYNQIIGEANSWGRFPDGADNFQVFAEPSPGS